MFDTSIALRLFSDEDPRQEQVAAFVNGLVDEGCRLFFAVQILLESRVVLTRPKSDNGYGRTAREFLDLIARISAVSTLISDPTDLIERWLDLCEAYGVIGKRCHELGLVALMQAHGVETIQTLNPKDFAAFPVTVLAPGTI